ncbi:intein-containing DNA-directed RNA polymerase iii subunit rpc2 precursor [Anaeramoeba ignava]|uniref:DNA-directed RNA polymerase n=3 Tax=Eukaryota TaxID=2759 RepID=A0A9Q0LEL1_ANAIG|nr:intein-containing DNA-directed RNA polymerase iii subunit rpc2 precursor [Anaeramoeba ignava]
MDQEVKLKNTHNILNELSQPIQTVEEKWKLLPLFFRTRGLLKQHIDSFNHLVNIDLKKILQANQKITCKSDPTFYMKYLDIFVGKPEIQDEVITREITPQQCRLRDITYSAPILVNVEFIRDKKAYIKKNVIIGRLPIMLRSEKCILYGKSDTEISNLGECTLDPGGYFIINGVEKICLIQEQLSRNRIIVDQDGKGIISANVISTTHERISRTSVILKKSKLYLKHNTFSEAIPIVIAFKALGIQSDQQIIQLIGTDSFILTSLSASFQESMKLQIFTQKQSLMYIYKRTKGSKPGRKQVPISYALDVVTGVILSHIKAENGDLRMKSITLALMVRRVLKANKDINFLDDRDYYGNKRLELTGPLLAILFDDLFKKFNTELSRIADASLSKRNLAAQFDIVKSIRIDTITNGLVRAIATGNWTLKRFKMARAGITQVLSRLSYISCLGMVTRISSQFEKTRKISGPRSLQTSQFGILCCSKDTSILMDDKINTCFIDDLYYNQKKDISIITVNPKSLEEKTSKITEKQHFYIHSLKQKLFTVKTVTDREICVTEDHPFLTKRGFVQAQHLTHNDCVCIRHTLENLSKTQNKTHFAITSEKQMQIQFPNINLNLIIQKLDQIKLLPLDSQNEKLSILTRLLGTLISRGNIISKQFNLKINQQVDQNDIHFIFCMDSSQDASQLISDCKSIGFSDSIWIKEKEKSKNFQRSSNIICKNNALIYLLLSLLHPLDIINIQQKNSQFAQIPKWILESSKLIKREWLSSVHGYFVESDLVQNGIFKRNCASQSFAKNFILQQILLFREFGIETTEEMYSSNLLFLPKDSFLNYWKKIGFRYCFFAEQNARITGEFLLYYRHLKSKSEVTEEKAIEKFRLNFKFENGMIFVPVDSISPETKVKEVYDLTTQSINHTFVANGFVTHNCPSDTPEGESCGLVKNLALLSHITTDSEEEPVFRAALMLGIEEVDFLSGEELSSGEATVIFLNGRIIGIHRKPLIFISQFRILRRWAQIAEFVSIFFNEKKNFIEISCDGGRLCRPLIIVDKNGKPRITKEHIQQLSQPLENIEDRQNFFGKVKYSKSIFKYFLSNGILEYLDVNEESNCNIALYENLIIPGVTTHLEIEPLTILGICAGIIPFPHHNQSPRNTYQCAMGKQAMSILAENELTRVDSALYYLCYPQKPLVRTKASDLFRFDRLPAGQNAMIAVMSYSGYDIEDAVILNKSSLDLGYGRCMIYRRYSAQISQYPNQSFDKLVSPSELELQRGIKFKLLDEDGICQPGLKISNGQVMFNKQVPKSTTDTIVNVQKIEHKSSPVIYKSTEGVIDRVILTNNKSTQLLVKSVIRSTRRPELGDKFCYDPKTQILTEKIMVDSLQKLNYSHKVATLVDFENIFLSTSIRIFKYNHFGLMYFLRNNAVDQLVTLNHKIFAKIPTKTHFDLENIEDVFGLEKYGIIQSQNFKSWIIFFAFWIQSFVSSQNKRMKKLIINLNYSESIRKLFLSTCQKLDLKINNEFGKKEIIIENGKLFKYFKSLRNEKWKQFPKIPNWIWKLNTEYSQLLLKTILKLEEHKTDDNYTNKFRKSKEHWSFKTQNKMFLNFLQQLSLHSELSADIEKRKEKKEKIYNIKIFIGSSIGLKSLEKTENQKEREEGLIEYSGKVYSCETTSGVIYVRRKGKSFWGGNSSRHGQKGVCGLIVEKEDLPFSENWSSSDMIMNPHGFPSRMTVGKMIELLGSKCALCDGNLRDGTVFSGNRSLDLMNVLIEYGYSFSGGRMFFIQALMDCLFLLIFSFGPVYYQKLKHMVMDKIFARSNMGPRTALTRQPTEGRARGGGLRLGEMERDCLVGYGSSLLLQERLMYSSDLFIVTVCGKCGSLGYDGWCPYCKSYENCTKLEMPYACKLLFQELQSMNIAPKLKLTDLNDVFDLNQPNEVK